MKLGRSYKLNREPSAAPARNQRAGAARRSRGILSNEQKAVICILAQQAAEKCGVTGWREIDAWRKEEQRKHFGLESLTAATQAQFSEIKAHFQALAGDLAGAYKTTRRGEDNGKRQARWLLNRALARAKLGTAYAAAICKTQFRCSLADASEKQLKSLLYTVNNRANARRRKAANADVDHDNIPF